MLMDRINIIHYSSIESTNISATDLLSNSSPIEGTVISAEFQSKGRGQIGRFWHSLPKLNLLFSTILYPTFLNSRQQFVISQLVCVALIKTLQNLGIDAKIKWPNDIYIEDQKVAGILIQNQIQGKSIKSTVIGIGINVNQESFPHDLPNPISLKQVLNRDLDTEKLLKAIWMQIKSYYHKAAAGKIDYIIREYHNAMYKIGEEQLLKSDTQFEGRIKGVNQIGQLLVEVAGKTHTFDFREVKWIF